VKGNKEEGQIILAPGQRAELNKKNLHVIKTFQCFRNGKDIGLLEWNQVVVPYGVQLSITKLYTY